MPKRTMTLAPKPGLIVRDPEDGRPIPEDGKTVQRSSYWLRRLRDGSVTQVTKPRTSKKSEPAKPVADGKKE